MTTPAIPATLTVQVTTTLGIQLQRIKWHHLQTEDYYVRLDGMCVGVVGRDGDRWIVSSTSPLLPRSLPRTRTYDTIEAAASALVRAWFKANSDQGRVRYVAR